VNAVKRAWDRFVDLLEGEDGPDELVYDPVHVAGVVVGILCAFGVLFWLLWTLLVFEGGLFTKVGPFFQAVFTSKTLQDFGYEGTPGRMGVFEGWIANVVALALSGGLLFGIWWLFQPTQKGKKS
jgi:uncharacterized membrane protein YedE/YeeE